MTGKAEPVGRRRAIAELGAACAGAVLGDRPEVAGKGALHPVGDVLPQEILRHGAYVCLRVPAAARRSAAAAEVQALAGRLGLRNEFDPGATGHPTEAVALLRRLGAVPRDVADTELLGADAILHVASRSADPVAKFCTEVPRLLGPEVKAVALRGVVRPPSYTGAAMHTFAYAHQVQQQHGAAMPNAFLIPMNKTAAWWAKDWMERHTYFLPRYDEAGTWAELFA